MSYKRNFTRYKNRGRKINTISLALKKLGINIFTKGGKIKKESDILKEMSKKWRLLS